jgi:WD40 repeat protein
MMDFKQRFEPQPASVITANPQVFAARFSPCGRYLVAGGYDGKVHRWDLSEKQPAKMPAVEGHHGWVQGLAFHPHEPLAYSADSWGQIRAWRIADAAAEPAWKIEAAHDGWIRDLAISPDGEGKGIGVGKILASCGLDQVIRIWSTADGSFVKELQGHNQDVYCLRFHPDGKLLISGDDRGVIKQWDLESGQCVRELDARQLYSLSRLQDVGGVRVLAFDKTGATLACGGTTPKNGGTVVGVPTILLFDFASGQLKTTIKHGSENDCFVHDIHLHEAGFVMAVTCGTPGQGKLLFQRPDDAEPFFVTTKMANTQSLSIHPDGHQFAVVATNPGSNGKNGEYVGNQSPIHLWKLPNV